MSVVAGMPVDKLQTAFKTKMVVRCMPNTPASVGDHHES
jgi:pyrroline-5-carboxylate reductase